MLQMGISEHFVEIQLAAACWTSWTNTNFHERAAISNIFLDVETGFVRWHTNLRAVLKVQVQ